MLCGAEFYSNSGFYFVFTDQIDIFDKSNCNMSIVYYNPTFRSKQFFVEGEK